MTLCSKKQVLLCKVLTPIRIIIHREYFCINPCIIVSFTSISDRFTKGCYALSVTGRLPPGIVRSLKNKGIHYRPRDVSMKSWSLLQLCFKWIWFYTHLKLGAAEWWRMSWLCSKTCASDSLQCITTNAAFASQKWEGAYHYNTVHTHFHRIHLDKYITIIRKRV